MRFLLCCIAGAASLLSQPATPSPHSAETAASAQKTVTRYCFGCHNDKLKTAGVSLATVKISNVGDGAATWERVFRKMRTGEMPPVGLPHPDAATNDAVVQYLEAELDKNALAKPNPGTPTIHRLNRAEYGNAIRDLLGLEFEEVNRLPADDSGYGFDNIGEVLTVSPLHMEKYLSAARRVSMLAVGTVRARPSVERYAAGNAMVLENGDDLPLSYRNGFTVRHHFPVDAEYTFRVRLRGNPPPNTPTPQLDVRLDGKRVELIDAKFDISEQGQESRIFNLRLPLKAGLHTVTAGILNESGKIEGGEPPPRIGNSPPPSRIASVDYVLIGGPFNPTGPGVTESQKRIFSCRPTKGQAETPCARKIISNLARHAYRRPVTVADVTPLMKLFAAGRQEGKSFEAGVENSLRAILVSPNFLYRVERSPAGATPGSVHAVTDVELASRLSFFLWSSIPDEELLKLAEQKKLRPNLEQQVRRMLADEKSRALVDNFAGQWLHLRNVATWRPDPDKYPQFDDSLRASLQRETELFFEHIVRDDRSVLDFVNADYSFLNDRLARHYGIPNVRGAYYRKVALNPAERGGILTQGAILTVTSYPTRTSPVLRGKWILENVLGSPPPPPPPDVPNLQDSAEISAKDLRKALEQHRASPACASCHVRLDPLGFSLEKYDATGRFRNAEGGGAIDDSGVMPGGTKFSGAGGLKQILLEHRDEFVECLSEKLLTYALGRGLEYYDLPAVREIRRKTGEGDHRFSALALAIVDSVPFQMRRSPER
jgi:hypothetical protein